jgi:hypothetical protein
MVTEVILISLAELVTGQGFGKNSLVTKLMNSCTHSCRGMER